MSSPEDSPLADQPLASRLSFSLAPGERFYAVHALARREWGAAGQLQAQGFRTFLPHSFKDVRHARTFRKVRAPLFPNYLFVVLDLDRDRWRSLNGTFGVSHVVMAGERPAPVPVGLVESLVELCDTSELIRFDQGLKPGQKVALTSGPFAGFVGELTTIDAAGRVKVLLQAMGARVPVLTTTRSLRPAA